MAFNLFKKKVEDEEFDELEDSPRKIRDLKPENRKKREEPKKPWGKFERLIVLITLLITIITAIVLDLKSKGYEFPRLNFNINNVNLFKSDTIIIEK